MTIRALIVDDEAPARQRIRAMLADHSGFEVAGESANGPDAIESIERLKPDVVFLDVQMPEMSGFEVVDAAGVDALQALVFVTAYDHYALKAFDARALDYLLKPFTAARFADTISRVRRTLDGASPRERQRVGDVLADVLPPMRDRRVTARDGERVVFVRLGEIEWMEGARNNVELHVGGRTLTVRGTLKSMTTRLAAAGFTRISHSVILNGDRIQSIERRDPAGFVVTMDSGHRLESSRGYDAALRELLRLSP
jgi:two-component system LytT family response regulator